ncbi:MAG: hypothetical protein WB592_01590, partial [Acidimicrobiales bacterium]
LGPAGRARGRWFEPPKQAPVLRIDPGPDAAGAAGIPSFMALLTTDWEVAVESDRVGTRLRPLDPHAQSGVVPPRSARAGIASRSTVTGAVQLPPDGCPIVLGPDHGTVGGYPVVAVVRRSSLADSGQLRPGDVVRFERAGSDHFDALGSRARRSVTGWMSTGLDGGH